MGSYCCSERRDDELGENNLSYSIQNQYQLFACISKGDYVSLRRMLSSGFIINFPMIHFAERTPLHIAAECGQLECVKLLLERGARVNAKDKYNTTPLMLALSKNSKDVVDLLLEKGASVTNTNSFNLNPYDYIPDNGNKSDFERTLTKQKLLKKKSFK